VESPTLLLVHGAWGGSWCWRDLLPVLDHHGVAFRTVDLPSSKLKAAPTTGLVDDADEVERAAQTIAGPIVLVGHSYGGAVVAEAATAISNLERVVFIAALVPHPGQSATDASREVRVRTLLDEAMLVEGDHLRLDPTLVARALYNHCDSDTSTWATSQLSTQTIRSFRSPRSSSDLVVPTRYIRCDDDFAVDGSLQESMAGRCDESISLHSDHSPFLSHPEELFEALMP